MDIRPRPRPGGKKTIIMLSKARLLVLGLLRMRSGRRLHGGAGESRAVPVALEQLEEVLV